MTMENMTLDAAREWVRDMARGEGARCPCCDQFAKVYRRTITSTMAHALVHLYHARGTWVHVPSHAGIAAKGGDHAKLAYWGLAEQLSGPAEDGNPHQGRWRITDAGAAWVNGATRVPRYVYLYDGKPVAVPCDETLSIHDALGTRFDYLELMAATAGGQ